MANTKPLKLKTAFTMRADDAFLSKLDDLRASDRPVKTRADMLRELVEDRWKRTVERRK